MTTRSLLETKLANLALARFGQLVYINGFRESAVVSNFELEDETGVQQQIYIEILPERANYYKTGDYVLINSSKFVVQRITQPLINETLSRLELKRA